MTVHNVEKSEKKKINDLTIISKPHAHPHTMQSFVIIQSTLVISTSLISNNRLSRSEILVPVLTWKSKNR